MEPTTWKLSTNPVSHHVTPLDTASSSPMGFEPLPFNYPVRHLTPWATRIGIFAKKFGHLIEPTSSSSQAALTQVLHQSSAWRGPETFYRPTEKTPFLCLGSDVRYKIFEIIGCCLKSKIPKSSVRNSLEAGRALSCWCSLGTSLYLQQLDSHTHSLTKPLKNWICIIRSTRSGVGNPRLQSRMWLFHPSVVAPCGFGK